LASLGAVATVGSPDHPPTVEELGDAVRALLDDEPRRRALSERSRALVDGLGARRVALAMTASSLALRPVTDSDALLMHRWRNDPATRAVSGDPGEIALEDHVRWLTRALADPNRTLFVGQVGSIDVGVIRFDAAPGGTHVVSLYLDPALHGLGLGARLLSAGEAAMRARQPRTRFMARVMPANDPSRRMFQSGGYRLHEDGLWHKGAPAPSEQVNSK
jgi:RimJ/RimL family protein N-acetyltransferase